jgi:hypothetical protein
MTYVTLYSFVSTYLALRKALNVNEEFIQNAAKYDKPCCSLEKNQQKGLFYLWAMEKIRCFGEDKDKFISIVNRWAKNCGDCTVSQAEIDAFLDSEEGISFITKTQVGDFLLMQNDAWLLQQNGSPILL